MTTVADQAFQWNDAFLLGYGPMDATHREFVTLVHWLRSCPDADLLGHLRDFERHAQEHFDQELAWMQSSSFPAMACHDDEHKAVQKSVGEVIERVMAGDFAVGRSLAQALVDWFPGHADYLDSALAQWMVRREMGGVPVVLRRTPKFPEVPAPR
jgi:hemerythrin